MNLIDLHCDTMSLINKSEDISLYKNNIQIDIEKLLKANSKAQFFALFIDLLSLKNTSITPFNAYKNMVSTFNREISKNSRFINISRNYDELQKNFKENKISAFLTIEDGGVLDGNLENLYKVYDDGVRLITLTWNHENELGYPNSKPEYQNLGIKNKGFDAIDIMNSKGMIIDVSHLSDKGFYDTVAYSTKPIVASHSNCRAIKNHKRNLTDDMIRLISNKGGVIGLNFYSKFLGNASISRVSDMICHIKHLKNIGGIDVISIGSDFDGTLDTLEIKDISKIDILLNALLKNNFTEYEIEKIFHKNIERVIKDVLK